MKKKVIVILSLIFIAIIIIGAIFAVAIYKNQPKKEHNIIGKEIIEPDRIVYKNSKGDYFQFLKGEKNYEKIKYLIEESIITYTENGLRVTDEEIDQIHLKSFIEFDYKTASKNYIIQLEENDNKAIIKLSNTGGAVFAKTIKNAKKLNEKISEISKDCKSYSLEYQEMLSRNLLEGLEYKYKQQFKEINYKIYQAKIENMEDYEKFEAMCNLAFDEEITEKTFDDNILILTVTLVPKIEVKINLGNIKYTYNKLENVNYQYTAHLLKVSKIVNADCIYNTDLTEISNQVAYDNMAVKYDESVDNLDKIIFMINYDEFIEEHQKSNVKISKEEANEIAEKGFKEAERICGSYDKNTQIMTEEVVKPNNFLTRKIKEGDKVYSTNVEVYIFKRFDEMCNGVSIYVDKKTGKIIGGEAFGD